MKPVWTKEHDKIVADYKNKKAKGQVKGMVVVPRDTEYRNVSKKTTGHNNLINLMIEQEEGRGYEVRLFYRGGQKQTIYLPLAEMWQDEFELGYFLPE